MRLFAARAVWHRLRQLRNASSDDAAASRRRHRVSLIYL